MNCKQGDLAIVVRSPCGKNFGKIVRCVRFIPEGAICNNGYPAGHDGWETDIPLEMSYTPTTQYSPDLNLRPIRDTQDEDETLTWAGKPQGVKECQ